jgi:hypothetical protein
MAVVTAVNFCNVRKTRQFFKKYKVGGPIGEYSGDPHPKEK